MKQLCPHTCTQRGSEACPNRFCSHIFSVGLILEPLEWWIVTSSMLTPRQTNGQRELFLTCAWKLLISVACLVFPFSLLCPTLLSCRGYASMTATSLSFLEVFGSPTLFSLKYLANWYQESSQVRWRACHTWLGFSTLRFCLLFFFVSFILVAFSMRRALSIPVPQGSVRYREPLKRVRPDCVRTPSVWDSSSNLGKDGLWRHRC